MSLKVFGREVAVSFGGLNILGRQTQGLTVNNEPVDVTDTNSGGWREVADIPGQKTVEMPISGVIKNLELLKGVMSTGSQKYAVTLTYPDGSTVSGNFFFQSYQETGEYNGAYTFDITLISDGAVTFTAGV